MVQFLQLHVPITDRDRMSVFTTTCTYADRDRMLVFTTTCTYH